MLVSDCDGSHVAPAPDLCCCLCLFFFLTYVSLRLLNRFLTSASIEMNMRYLASALHSLAMNRGKKLQQVPGIFNSLAISPPVVAFMSSLL